jgi:hypothetical protein
MISEVYNRHVLVRPIEEEQEETSSLIALPEDYKKPESPYAIVEILDFADDCTCYLAVSSYVVIERRMMIEVEIKGQKDYLVLENYIYGSIDNEVD